jgi:hypothetical protein
MSSIVPLKHTDYGSVLPSGQEWKSMSVMAADLLESGFLPKDIDTWQKALAIIAKGSELRIPPMQALTSINVIRGKPSCSAELMLALAQRDHGDNAIDFVESTPQRCVIEYKRRTWVKPRRYEFTIEEANDMGLTATAASDRGPKLWQKAPKIMLRARCVSAVCRMAFADSISGMYSPDELDAPVKLNEDGAVVIDGDAYATIQASAPTPIREHPKATTTVTDTTTGEVIDAVPQTLEQWWSIYASRYDGVCSRTGIDVALLTELPTIEAAKAAIAELDARDAEWTGAPAMTDTQRAAILPLLEKTGRRPPKVKLSRAGASFLIGQLTALVSTQSRTAVDDVAFDESDESPI